MAIACFTGFNVLNAKHHMKNQFIAFIVVFTALTLHAHATPNPEAPKQLHHWSPLIGKWRTTEEGLKPDGSAWQPSKSAQWNFYWAMDGWAVRDEYFSPPLDDVQAEPLKRQIGTNLRIFNADKNEWIMAWLTKDGKRVDVYQANSDGNTIVMRSAPLTEGGKHRRITFFDIKKDSFEWKLEFSNDGQSNWLEVYRIHGKRE